jgi:hypothetical protein
MAGKKKKNQEQTFNVYPYLGGYQHFMKDGGALPKFNENGQVNIADVTKRIRPTNRYKYDRTFDGLKEEWQNNVGNQGDRDKYNTLGGLGTMGLTANLFKGASDLVGDVKGVFNKDSYTSGGKYSKFDDDGGLRYGQVNLQNTTDKNALLHGENFAKYLDMSNKERKKLTESGDLRNTDLWWSTDDLQYGKHNWMDKNENGTAKFDGLNYQVAKKRSEEYVNPDTGERLFSTKQKNKDGTFTYFNEDGTIDNQKTSQTQYDLIEEGKGEGGLGDVNAESMIFDFDKEGDNKLAGFSSHDETTITKSSCSDGTSLSETDCTSNGGTWSQADPTTNTELKLNEYKSDEIYGPHKSEEIVQEESNQERLNRLAKEQLKYGAELKKMMVGGDGIMGGLGQDDIGGTADFKTNFHQFDIEGPIVNDLDLPEKYDGYEMKYGGSLPKFVNGGAEDEEETDDQKQKRIYEESIPVIPETLKGEKDYGYNQMLNNFTAPTGNFSDNPYGPQFSTSGPSFDEAVNSPDNNARLNFDGRGTDIQAEPKSTWEEPNNVDKFKNWFKGDAHLNKDPGPDLSGNPEMEENIDVVNKQREGDKTLGYDARVLDPTNRTDMEGAAPEGSDNLGIDVSYGDGPIQSTYNKTKEVANTGAIGAGLDILGKSSEFVVDKFIPFADDIYNRNVNKQNEMFKRSVSAEDVAPMMEETAGTGSRGYADINKGGYGDSLYGTGKVFGQAQQGQELMPEEADLSGVVNFMEPSFDGLKYKDEYLSKQKTYLGKMQDGAELSKLQVGGGNVAKRTGKWVWNGLKYIWTNTKAVNPLAFNPLDNVFFSTGKTPGLTKIDFTKTPLEGGKSENIGFMNINDFRNAPSSVEMVSVLDEYRKTGIGTSLYRHGVNATKNNAYPGLISGETLKNPEATVNIWKHFDIQTQGGKPLGTTPAADGTKVKLVGTKLSGNTKADETEKFYNDLGVEESSIFNTDITKTQGEYNFNSPLWRGIRSGFNEKDLHIGNGEKPFTEYNKLPLLVIPGLATYGMLSSDNKDGDYETEYKQEYLNKQAKDAGFSNTKDYIEYLNDTNRTMSRPKNDIMLKYKDSLDEGIYKYGGNMDDLNRGGNTAQSSILSDASGQPIEMQKFQVKGEKMETASIYDMPNKDGAYDDQSWFTKANHGFSENMYNTSQKTNSLAAPVFGKLGKVMKTEKLIDGAKNLYNKGMDWYNNDQSNSKIAGPPEGVGTMNTAENGGEQNAEIDMDLYYELMQAGADIKITR